MLVPEIVKFGDGFFRRVMYGLGPYIADYPEQVLLACIVSGWCARFLSILNIKDSTYTLCRCSAKSWDLDGGGFNRSQVWTDFMATSFTARQLWDDYGIVADLIVRTILPRKPLPKLISFFITAVHQRFPPCRHS